MFSKLGLSSALTRAIEAAGYTHPTPVQSRAIPPALLGRDLMVAAQTGTGKTASFALPILELIFCRTPAGKNRLRPKQPRSLILTPTRELAAQVHNSFLQYSINIDLVSACIFGGVGAAPQVEAMAGGVDVLVACPGRLLDLIQQKQVDLEGVKIFVLDEADRMLDMGFIHDVKKVMAKLPQQRQNLLYSATFSPDIIALADRLLHSPERIEVTPPNSTVERIQQAVYHVPIAANKKHLLAHLITQGQWVQVLVFTRTKHGANKLAEFLCKQGINSAAIHGNKSQTARTKALADFKSNEVRVLVATDIAARGLDIDQLPHVVNFELPNVEEDYVHRIGRTGRAGRDGEAVSLVSPDEVKLLRDIEKMTKQRIPEGDWMGYSMTEMSKEVEREHERDWNRDREKLSGRFANSSASNPLQSQERLQQKQQKPKQIEKQNKSENVAPIQERNQDRAASLLASIMPSTANATATASASHGDKKLNRESRPNPASADIVPVDANRNKKTTAKRVRTANPPVDENQQVQTGQDLKRQLIELLASAPPPPPVALVTETAMPVTGKRNRQNRQRNTAENVESVEANEPQGTQRTNPRVKAPRPSDVMLPTETLLPIAPVLVQQVPKQEDTTNKNSHNSGRRNNNGDQSRQSRRQHSRPNKNSNNGENPPKNNTSGRYVVMTEEK